MFINRFPNIESVFIFYIAAFYRTKNIIIGIILSHGWPGEKTVASGQWGSTC